MSDNMPIFIKNELLTRREYLIKRNVIYGISIAQIARESGISRDTLHRWKKRYLSNGVLGLLPKSRKPKTSPNTVDEKTTKLIKKIRRTIPRFGAEKIQIRLKKKYNIKMSWQGVHKVLKREGLVYRKKRMPRKDKWKKYRAKKAGELVQIDVKYAHKIKDKWFYQYTAVDVATRMKFARMYTNMGNWETIDFVSRIEKHFPFKINGIQTDNASYFTNRYTGYVKSTDPLNPKIHILDLWCNKRSITHYLIDKGKPAQNGCVERSHRTDNEEFYQTTYFKNYYDFEKKFNKYIEWYNRGREHLGINGLTPWEKYKELKKLQKSKQLT